MHSAHRKFYFVPVVLGITAPLWLLPGAARAQDRSQPAIQVRWAENNLAGNEGVNAYGAPPIYSGYLTGYLPAATPTPAISDAEHEANEDQTSEDVERVAVPAPVASADASYGGTFLVDLFGKAAPTGALKLASDNIATDDPLAASKIVAQSDESLPESRVHFQESNQDVPDASESGDSEWWYNSKPAPVAAVDEDDTAISSGDISDLGSWSDIDGHSVSSEPVVLETVLAGVTPSGISLGSGTFYSDGLGFSAGGRTAVKLDSISIIPKPAVAALLAIGATALIIRQRRRIAKI
jgi:hypothetical protein